MLAVLLDRRCLFRESLVTSLGRHLEPLGLVGTAGLEPSPSASPDRAPSVILLVWDGCEDPAATLRDAVAVAPTVVLFDDERDPQLLLRLIDLGARGVIPLSTPIAVTAHAIRLVQQGGTYMPATRPAAAGLGLTAARESAQAPLFTLRQRKVIDSLRQGKANKLIAHELQMSEATVKVHLRHIMRKLKANNRTQVVCRIEEMERARGYV
jgi:DNA-binding NarL/FixJ family response regulator